MLMPPARADPQSQRRTCPLGERGARPVASNAVGLGALLGEARLGSSSPRGLITPGDLASAGTESTRLVPLRSSETTDRRPREK